MKVLQIACGFSYSKVYENLFAELNKKNVEMEVYVPQHADPKISQLSQNDYPYPIYSNKIIKSWDKYIYFTKILKMKNDIEKNFDLAGIQLIHAHSLFSDGGVAYEVYKKYKIPYMVAIRNTDINQYFKKAKHLKPYALNILKNAEKVIFLSEAYRKNLFENFIPNKLKTKILKKTIIIPNGVSKFWLDNIYESRGKFDKNKGEINLIFVGQIIRLKNIESAIKAGVRLAQKIERKVNFSVVGPQNDSKYYDEILKLGGFKYDGYYLPQKLIEKYRNADIFVMPSLKETFGLVYVEAMTQGLPLIYTKGQGFDGQLEEGLVGYSVNPLDIEEISDKIVDIIKNYDAMSSNCIKNATQFDWEKIACLYKELYFQIFKCERINNMKKE